uniref:Lectin_legB domain-containing protein n=1 Tax=Rhabditophanes sp. KR3021 TaxID=114890 RepID=A0AC35UF83_9BILA
MRRINNDADSGEPPERYAIILEGSAKKERNNKRHVVAFYLDESTSNEGLALEYAVISNLQDDLTNIDGSGQPNNMMVMKHPDIATQLSPSTKYIRL